MRSLPVTDSWNSAIDLATGDYVVFLGDDDGLAPRYFSRIEAVIREFHSRRSFTARSTTSCIQA